MSSVFALPCFALEHVRSNSGITLFVVSLAFFILSCRLMTFGSLRRLG